MRVFFRLFSHHRSPLPHSFLLLFLLQYLTFSHSHVLRRRHAPLTRLSSSSSSSSDDSSSLSPLLLSVREDDGRGGSRPVEYNPLTQRFEPLSLPSSSSLPSTTLSPSSSSLKRFLSRCFLPGGDITPDYYRYTLWRIGQRLVSATSAVFGTQALLMALGVSSSSSSSSLLGIHAATMWVLKDALGKCSRIVWASKVIPLFYSNIYRPFMYTVYDHVNMFRTGEDSTRTPRSGDSGHLCYIRWEMPSRSSPTSFPPCSSYANIPHYIIYRWLLQPLRN